MALSPEQIKSLDAPLDARNVKKRPDRGQYSYIEAWHAIAEANRIFGFDGWDSTTEITQLGEPRQVEEKWRVAYMGRVRIQVGTTFRDGIGYGSGIAKDLGDAHESAIKEAESDARKRALMTFGNQFGLALYDKEQENVTAPNGVPKATKASPVPKPIKAGNPTDWTKAFIETASVATDLSHLTEFEKTNKEWLDKLPAPLFKQCADALKQRSAFLSQQPLSQAAE